jgi:hypothetical protein
MISANLVDDYRLAEHDETAEMGSLGVVSIEGKS